MKSIKKCVGFLLIWIFSFFFSTFSVFGSISAFNSLAGVPVGIMKSEKRVEGFYEGLKICAIIAGVKNYKSITKKKRKNIIKQCC